MPDDAETAGLRAHCCLHLRAGRQDGRRRAAGDASPEQGQLFWNEALIAEGTAVLDEGAGAALPPPPRLLPSAGGPRGACTPPAGAFEATDGHADRAALTGTWARVNRHRSSR